MFEQNDRMQSHTSRNNARKEIDPEVTWPEGLSSFGKNIGPGPIPYKGKKAKLAIKAENQRIPSNPRLHIYHIGAISSFQHFMVIPFQDWSNIQKIIFKLKQRIFRGNERIPNIQSFSNGNQGCQTLIFSCQITKLLKICAQGGLAPASQTLTLPHRKPRMEKKRGK